MKPELRNELIRQGLRFLSVLLLAVGVPVQFTALLENVDIVNLIVMSVVPYLIAEGAWLKTKLCNRKKQEDDSNG